MEGSSLDPAEALPPFVDLGVLVHGTGRGFEDAIPFGLVDPADAVQVVLVRVAEDLEPAQLVEDFIEQLGERQLPLGQAEALSGLLVLPAGGHGRRGRT